MFFRGAVSQAERLSKLLVDLGYKQMDADRALGTVLRRALHVRREDGRRVVRLSLLEELVPLRQHPDASQAPALVDTVANVSGRLEAVLLRTADRDLKAGEEIFLWPPACIGAIRLEFEVTKICY